MTITVMDVMTNMPIKEAVVDISLNDNIVASAVKTDANGNVEVPASMNGDYSITVAKLGYSTVNGNKTIECSTTDNCTCDTVLILSIDQPRCDPNEGHTVNLPVIVKDNITNQMIEGALVTLILTNSLSGPSMITVDRPKYTDSRGTAQFPLSMNGDYSVQIIADGYVEQSMPIEVACNPDHCQLCTPSASVTLNQEFCQDKYMKMNVKNSLDNKPVVGALVKVSLDTFEGPKEISSLTVGESGQVEVLLIANGLYFTEVSMPKYTTAKSSFVVNMTSDECDIIHPVSLTPLSPEAPSDCVRLSLTWGEEPQDLDLYSYRVHENNTEDQCLTYYCNGKDPCNGTAFEVDNKNGGLNGSETITYCSTDEYTNMVYVDDLSGQGSSLISSEARLVIIGSDRTEEVVLNPNEENANGQRYWLAGCLTTTSSGTFEFISVNQFQDVQPNVEEPLHCHNRVAVENAAYSPLVNATARVVVTNALTDEPLDGVMTSFSFDGNSRTGLTGSDGIVNIPISKNGDYSVIAELDGFIPQTVEVTVDCQTVNCQTDAAVAMLPINQGNELQILLNWGTDAEDLDLHVIQVDKNDNRVACETFYNNMNGCKDSSLNQNIKDGSIDGSETVTIKHVTSNAMMSYMVFAHDNSLSDSSLSSSQADITVTDGTNTVKEMIPPFTVDTVAGARYWLAGCIQIVGETFNYIPVNRFSRESPSVSDKLFCDNLVKNTLASTPEPFCDNINFDIDVHSSMTNNPIENATAFVIMQDADIQKTIAVEILSNSEGKLKIPIKQNGHYVVKVEKDGYISAKESMDVSCDIARCNDCKPRMLVPLSPELAPGSIRLTMGWGEMPLDLDVYAQQKNIFTEEACETYYGRKTGCDGISLDLDNVNGGHNGVETMTFHDDEIQHDSVYMVFVHHFGSTRDTEEFRSSGVHLTITDGLVTSVITMNPENYNGEEHWLAGCMRKTSSGFEFEPVNSFLNSKPSEEVPNLCLEKFGHEVSTERSYSWYDPRRYYG